MRRILIVFCFFFVSVPAFASVGKIGASFSPEFTIPYGKVDSAHGFTIMVDGSNTFEENGILGIEYGNGIKIPMNSKNTASQFLFKLGLFYKLKFTDMIGLDISGGFRERVWLQTSVDEDYYSMAVSASTDFYISAATDFTFFDAIGLSAGLMIAQPLVTMSLSDNSYDGGRFSVTGPTNIYISPFIGIYYVY